MTITAVETPTPSDPRPTPVGMPDQSQGTTGVPVPQAVRQAIDDDDPDDDSISSDDDDVGGDGDDMPGEKFGEDLGEGGFNDGLDQDDDLDEFDDIDEDDFDDDFDDDFEEELIDDYEIEIDDEISAEFGLNSGGGDGEEEDIELEDFDDFDSLHRD